MTLDGQVGASAQQHPSIPCFSFKISLARAAKRKGSSVDRHDPKTSMAEIAWRGSLAALRDAGCPLVPQKDTRPRDTVIVLDDVAIDVLNGSELLAIASPMFRNTVVIPELALDMMDVYYKQTRELFNMEKNAFVENDSDSDADEATGKPQNFVLPSRLSIQTTLNNAKRAVMVDKIADKVVLQRVHEYDFDLMRELGVQRNSDDPRLYLLCTLYFKRKTGLPTVLVTDNTALASLATQHGLTAYPTSWLR